MMKKKHYLISILMCTVILTACGHEHSFCEASCEAPATCAECGASQEGSVALGHDFTEATCTEPPTCTRCGQSQGEALGHDYAEATCTEPSTCVVCGEVTGEALGHNPEPAAATMWDDAVCSNCHLIIENRIPGSFEENGIICHTDLDVPYEYPNEEGITDLNEDGVHFKVTYSNYRCFESDSTHEALDGYVWQQVDIEVIVSHPTGTDPDFDIGALWEDYYDPKLAEDTERENKGNAYTVNFRDGCFGQCFREIPQPKYKHYPAVEDKDGWGWSWPYYKYETTATFRVPRDYDGAVIGITTTDCHDGRYVYEYYDGSQILFRFPSATIE